MRISTALLFFTLSLASFSGAYAKGEIQKRTQPTMDKDAKVFVAGHRGLVGSALMRELERQGYTNIVTRTHAQVDLCDPVAVDNFFSSQVRSMSGPIEYIFLAAAKVGGIWGNYKNPVPFIRDNILIEMNVIDAAHRYDVTKLIFLGSSCIYPKFCQQPIKEEYFLTGELEPSNEHYAIAKIAGIKACQAYNRQYGTNFIACMPTNLYGPCDNFDLETSHVLPALLSKFYTAKKEGRDSVVVWGTGTPYREFLYIDDLASAVVHLMNYYDGNEIVNVGTGKDITIGDVARVIKEVVGFEGNIVFDTKKSDGAPRKLLDVSRLRNLGWQASTALRDGIQKTLDWCIKEGIFQ